MDPRRLRAGEAVAALSGAALLAALFLPWYGDDLSGWAALGVIDLFLAFLALLALALVVVTAWQPVPPAPLVLAVLLTFAGALGTVLVLFRAIDLPAGAEGREWALWLALAGALGTVAAGWLAMTDERLSPPGRHTDASGRPAPPPAAIETIPAAGLDERTGKH
jgi:hypothetical protein